VSLFVEKFILKVSGWGKSEFNASSPYSSFQKEIDLPLVDYTTCQNQLRATRLSQNFQLDFLSFICAGGEFGKDAVRKELNSSFWSYLKFLSNSAQVTVDLL
jgi:hypothetical protein